MKKTEEEYLQKIARYYSKNLSQKSVLSYDDLYQEGYLVLLHCRKHFKEESGTSLTTYFISCVNGVFKGLIQKDMKRIKHMSALQEKSARATYEKDTNSLFDNAESLMSKLGEEAKLVLNTFLNIPREQVELFKRTNSLEFNTTVSQILNISKHKVDEHLKNVKTVLLEERIQ